MTIILKPGSVPLETLEKIYREGGFPSASTLHSMPVSKKLPRALRKSRQETRRFTASIPVSENSPRSVLQRAMSPRFNAI
ncbi:histidine ammonia-lyase [Brucella sp. 63/311]|nr:histidine ammonia-lyase [Brucella sp. 63/311]